MKKLFNSKFLFILASSLVVLILLTVGAFYLFDDEDDTFIKSGYVLNPLSSTSERYFFDENVGYKENLSSMVEFVDKNDKTVTILKDSFLHYSDGSLSFLKKGAILDLNTIKNSKVVSFYNITKQSVIEKDNEGYLIESASGDIKISNFIGRISDNKYIFAGDLSLRIAGNDKVVEGEYFEVVYIEEGIVNIENEEVKYQVAAEGTSIYVDNKVIDLGGKKITVDNKDIMSLTSITIDGEENIEIIPKGNKEEENNGEDNATDDDSQNTDDNQQGTQDDGNNLEGNTGTGDNETGDGKEDGNLVLPVELQVSLKDAEVASTRIYGSFYVLNASADDVLKLRILNLDTGVEVEYPESITNEKEFSVEQLTPNVRYLFTVVNLKNNEQCFQKIFEMNSFGIKLEKSYATSDKLVYKIVFEYGTDIRDAKISLRQFNEQTMEYDVVTTTHDGYSEVQEFDFEKQDGIIVGEYIKEFDDLESDTIYTVVIDDFIIGAYDYDEQYEIPLTSMTLKETPKFNKMKVQTNESSFEISHGEITDDDNAIIKYTYNIKEAANRDKTIDSQSRTNAAPITFKVGSLPGELSPDVFYVCEAVVEYFDNEKYIEYVAEVSVQFIKGSEPTVEITYNEDDITHDTIKVNVKLLDPSCLISQPGRGDVCGGEDTTEWELYKIIEGPLGTEYEFFRSERFAFYVDSKDPSKIERELIFTDLEPGTKYQIRITSRYNNSNEIDPQPIMPSENSPEYVKTKAIASFKVSWEWKQGNEMNPINAFVKFLDNKKNGSLTSAASLPMIDEIILTLYEGRYAGDLKKLKYIDEQSIYNNIKKDFYDESYNVLSLDTFGWDMASLIQKHGEQLSEYYTIVVEAKTIYGDVDLVDNIYPYRVAASLRMDEITKPNMVVNAISNKESEYKFKNLTDNSKIVGYSIETTFVKSEFRKNKSTPISVDYEVFDTNGQPVKFYILEDEKLVLKDSYRFMLDENIDYDLTTPVINKIYLDYGTPYQDVDNIMRRGNEYMIVYTMNVLADGVTDEKLAEKYPQDENDPEKFGLYESVSPEKQLPQIKIYPATSDKNSITYKYTVKDPDNALYNKDGSEDYQLYYFIGEDGNPNGHNLIKVPDTAYNQFDGRVKISGLSNGTVYGYYFEVVPFRNGSIESSLIQYVENRSPELRTFDGYYNENDSSYDLSYSIIYNPDKDNKVAIRMNASEKILNRALAYNLEFTTADGDVYRDNTQWELSTCPGEPEDSYARCLYVEYTKLEREGMLAKDISVKVDLFYDNGLTGYDFKVGEVADADFKYAIMQKNSSGLGMGNYVVTNDNKTLSEWTVASSNKKGYYTYEIDEKNLLFNYFGHHLTGGNGIEDKPMHLDGSGYTTNEEQYTLNPKMVSDVSLKVKGENKTFIFYSIKPKVAVRNMASLLDGNYLRFKLSGIVDAKRTIKNEGGKYFLYLATWDNIEDAKNDRRDKVVRPIEPIEITNPANPEKELYKLIGGLLDGTTYYHNVYAKLWQGDDKYPMTQLYDNAYRDDYVVTSYPIDTLRYNQVFNNNSSAKTIKVNYSIPEIDKDNLLPEDLLPENYSNRQLNIDLDLSKYNSNLNYNFALVYVLCEADSQQCDYNDGNNIFAKEMSEAVVVDTYKTKKDILYDIDLNDVLPEGYTLEYGKEYTMYVYAKFYDWYKTPTDIDVRHVLLNPYLNSIELEDLEKPSFVVTREALIDSEGKYYIDFTVALSDDDRTLNRGEYYVSLKNNGELKGTMQLNIDGVYTPVGGDDYSTYALSGYQTSRVIRITDLEPDTEYDFNVFGTATMDNASIPVEERQVYVDAPYTVYTANDLGVAFGHDIRFNATEKSVVATFRGGSSFDNVKLVRYTVVPEDGNGNSYGDVYDLVKDNKAFKPYGSADDDSNSSVNSSFVIEPPGMVNTLGMSYHVTLRFCIGESADNCIWYPDETTSLEIVKRFEGIAYYVADQQQNTGNKK